MGPAMALRPGVMLFCTIRPIPLGTKTSRLDRTSASLRGPCADLPAIPGASQLPVKTAAAAKSLQSCSTLCDPHRQHPTRLPRPWDSPGKNTGVGCHFLLQCMKVKSESEVAQSCPTPSNPMGYSLPGSSIHGIFQARVLEWVAIAFSTSQD